MIRIVGVHRSQHANVVDMFAQLRQQFTDGYTAFATLVKLERRGQQATGWAFGGEIRTGRTLPGVLLELRFGIEQIPTERSAVHKEVNNTFRTRREVAADRVRCGRLRQTLL